MRILIINGPNLNLLGTREPEIYGHRTFENYFDEPRELFPQIEMEYYQSNIEGALIDKIQESQGKFDGIILNAAAYAHTSVGIADAVRAVDIPVIEVHISNTFSREDYRHKSFIAPVAHGIIIGFGLKSYELAVMYFNNQK